MNLQSRPRVKRGLARDGGVSCWIHAPIGNERRTGRRSPLAPQGERRGQEEEAQTLA